MSTANDDPLDHRVGLTLFAIPFGFAGLGGAWTAAATVLGAPEWPEDALFTVSGVLWLSFTVVYVAERVRRRGAFRADREHPTDGANAAFPPVIGILLTAHFGQYLPGAAPWICGLFVAAAAIVAAQILVHWLTHPVSVGSLHPGYFLPLVAGPFIASIGLAGIHAQASAMAALGVGGFFWVLVGGIVTARLIIGEPLPPTATPALSILLAPAATGGVAAFAVTPGQIGAIHHAFLGVFVVMVLVQVFLIGEYRKLSFSLSFWTFTFPAAVSANYAIRWLGLSAFDNWQVVAWILLGLATVLVLSVAVASVGTLLGRVNGGLLAPGRSVS